jgi:hypothetical protein
VKAPLEVTERHMIGFQLERQPICVACLLKAAQEAAAFVKRD